MARLQQKELLHWQNYTVSLREFAFNWHMTFDNNVSAKGGQRISMAGFSHNLFKFSEVYFWNFVFRIRTVHTLEWPKYGNHVRSNRVVSQKPSYSNVPCHCPAVRRTHDDIQQHSAEWKNKKRNPFKVFFRQLNFISFILFPVLLLSSSLSSIVRPDGPFVACLVDFSIFFSCVSRRVASLVHQYRVPLLDLVEYENLRGWRLWSDIAAPHTDNFGNISFSFHFGLSVL